MKTPTRETPPAAAPTVDSALTSSTPGVVSVAAVGDMQFDRGVRALVAREGGAAPLKWIAADLRNADVTIGNLESSLSDKGRPDPHKDVTLHGAPAGVEGLRASGFDLVSMANNHVLDYGPAALTDTVRRLDSAGIAHAGAGKDAAAAWRPAIVERNGKRIAFLSFSDVVHPGFAAGAHRPGLAPALGDFSAVTSAIRAARRKADYVIVAFHWGVEYQSRTTGGQIRQAHKAIDAGADLVLAHHPHVIQGVETYKGRLIAYSLGDFVFDHFSRATGETFVLRAALTPRGVTEARLVPAFISADGTPQVVAGSAADSILARLKAMSAKLNTKLTIDGPTASVVIP